jgi:Flp pilus assembly protein TadG
MVHGNGQRALRLSERVRRGHLDQRGVVAVMTALMMVLMISVVAIVIDLGNARQQRREAQASADSAALAGGEAIESGMSTTTGSIPWSTVVSQIKSYAKANDNVSLAAWNGCTDTYALAYRPDTSSGNNCISATASSFPAPSAATVGDNVDSLRVRLPSSTTKSFFGKAVGNNDLTVGASATAKVVFTVTQSQTTTLAAGGPCALCILNPSGVTLDGQNGDVTITGGNVIVNSTSSTSASLNPNGHVAITTTGGVIGGPGSCAPSACNNFSGAGFSPAWSRQGAVIDPLAHVPQCGDGSRGDGSAASANLCPTNNASAGHNGDTLSPGIYGTIANSHHLNPGIYVITNGITLNGNDLIEGDGVMLYFACSNYPSPCPAVGTSNNITRAGITATGNGALRITGITQSQCTANANYCPYVGMMDFADRKNDATQTWRGNGTNENGQSSGISGTIYMYSGTMDLRGNGYQMASQIVVSNFTMKGNPSTVTLNYDQSKNYTETHPITTPSYNATVDNNGLAG